MIWPLIICSYFSLFVFGITDNTRGPLFPEILKTFNVSDSTGALLFTFSAISGCLISFGSIYLLKKFSRKFLIEMSCLLLIIALVGLGLASQFYWFIFASVLFGLASGVLGLIPNILVPIGTTLDKRQQFISGLHAMYGISSLLSPFLVSVCFFYFHTWRATFFACTLFPLSLLIYTYKQDANLFNQNKSTAIEKKNKKNLREIFPNIFLAATLSFAVIGEVMLTSRLALYMRRAHQFDLYHSGLYVTYFFLAMLIGRSFFAYKKFSASIPMQLSILGILTINCLLAGVFFHPMFLILAGFFVSPYYPLMATYIAAQFPNELDLSMSLVVAIDSIMLALMHVLIGRLTDLYGIQNALLMGVIFFSISIICVNIFNKKISRTNGKES